MYGKQIDVAFHPNILVNVRDNVPYDAVVTFDGSWVFIGDPDTGEVRDEYDIVPTDQEAIDAASRILDDVAFRSAVKLALKESIARHCP